MEPIDIIKSKQKNRDHNLEITIKQAFHGQEWK